MIASSSFGWAVIMCSAMEDNIALEGNAAPAGTLHPADAG